MDTINKSFWIILCIFSLQASYSAEVFFTPSTQCEDHIIDEIGSAQKSVDVAVYSINNDKIVTALIASHKNGIRIRILTDNIQAAGPSSKIIDLINAGLDLKVHSVHKIMHNKFAIFDEKKAVNGSFNWTNPASSQNNENCVFFSNQEANVIANYHNEFEKLWEQNSKDKSLKKIAKIVERKKNRKLASTISSIKEGE